MPRLSQSETRLLISFAAAIGLVAGVLLLQSGLHARSDLERRLKAALDQRAVNEALLSEAPMWETRRTWLQQQLPRYATATAASPAMQEAVKTTTERHGMTLKSQSFIPKSEIPENPAASAVGLRLELTGQLANVVAFLHDLQQPGRFIEIRELTLKPEGETGSLICTLALLQYFREG